MLTEGTSFVVRRRFDWKLAHFATLVTLSLFAILAPARSPGQDTPVSAQRPAIINSKAQEIIDKTIQALGGASFLAFKRLSTTGRAFAIYNEQTVGLAPFESVVEYPDKRR